MTALTAKRCQLLRRRGSLSLFMTLVLSSLLLVFSVYWQAALLRSYEVDISRALSAQIQVSLAAYDRDLLDQYGLFAFRSDLADQTAFRASLPPALSSQKLQLVPRQPLGQADVLQRQIVSYMQARLPLIYMEQLFIQLDALSKPSDGQGRLLADVSGWLRQIPASEARQARAGLFGGLLDQLEDDAALQLDAIYRQAASQWLSVPDDSSFGRLLSQMPDFFDPASLALAADQLDQLLSFSTPPLYEKCCLAEYVLGQFSADVTVRRLAGQSQPLQTINGRLFLEFPENRTAEVEQILSGIDNPATARLLCGGVLVSLRTLLQLAHIVLDPEQMALIRGTAVTISAAVAAATAGSVVIDPEIMTWLVAVGKALYAGWNDLSRLREGSPVALWPDEQIPTPALYYADYLRLFLLAMPRHLLLERVAAQIDRNLSGTYYTGLQVQTVWQGRTLALAGEYP